MSVDRGNLQAIVRDLVLDLEVAAGDRATPAHPEPEPVVPSPAAEVPVAPPANRNTIQPLADILVLPGRDPAPEPRDEAAVRRFLGHITVASAVHRARRPVRLRRVPVQGHPASVAEALRRTSSRTVPIASWLLDPPALRDGAGSVLRPAPAPEPSPPPAPAETVAFAVVQVVSTPPLGIPAEAEPEAPAGEAAMAPVEAPAPATTETEEADAVAAALATVAAGLEELEEPEAGPSRWRGRVLHAANLVLAAAVSFVLICCGLIVAALVTGHRVEQVVTGSMTPNIPVQSLVVTERLPASDLKVGDVLVFPNPNNPNEVIVHRIYTLTTDGDGNVIVRTKGDANAGPDGWTVKRPGSAFADRGTWVIPGGGIIAQNLRLVGFFGLLALIIGSVLWFGVRLVVRIVREEPEPDADASAAA